MKELLLLTDVNFWVKGAGHRMRISNLIEHLTTEVKLTILYIGIAPLALEEILSNSLSVNFHLIDGTRVLEPHDYGKKIKSFLKNKIFDCYLIEFIHNSYYLNYLPLESLIILDAHDIISERTEEFRKFNYAGATFELLKEAEVELLNFYDYVILLCTPDIEKIRRVLDPQKVLLCPHPVKLCHHSIRYQVQNIVFIASEYLPNKDGIEYFIETCWPEISKRFSVSLYIYGNICNKIIVKDENDINLMGYVSNLNEIYDCADIIINPVRFGAGLKIKNIEALANGIPLVTTSHGARGLEKGINNAFLIADEPQEFIEAISTIIENSQLRSKLKHEGHRFIEENFSYDICFKPLLDVIKQ